MDMRKKAPLDILGVCYIYLEISKSEMNVFCLQINVKRGEN